MNIADSAPRESVRRFDLALQRSHFLVYTAGAITGLVGAWLGVFEIRFVFIATVWSLGCVSSLVFHELFRRGFDRRILNPIWMAIDVSWLVPLSGWTVRGSSGICRQRQRPHSRRGSGRHISSASPARFLTSAR